MFKQIVFELTEKGEREIRLSMLSLSGDARLILPLFDNGATVDDIVAILPPSARQGVEEIAHQLLESGYIVQQDAANIEVTHRIVREASYTAMPVIEFQPDTGAVTMKREIARYAQTPHEHSEAATSHTIRGMVDQALHAEHEKHTGMPGGTSAAVSLLEMLRALDFFKGFSTAELLEVARIVVWHEQEANQIMLRTGDAVESFYVLLHGSAGVLKQQKQVGLIEPGESFGEFAYLLGEPAMHAADVIAKTYVEFLEFPTEKLSLCSQDVRLQFSAAFARVQTRRLVKANEQIVNLLANEYK